MSHDIDVADLIGVANPQPCPQCRHPEIVTLLRRGEPPRALTFYCRHCMWVQGKHALVRDYMEHCGHHFAIVCAACGRETDDDWIEAGKNGWKQIERAWICYDHALQLQAIVLAGLLDDTEIEFAIKEGRLP
jgi:hypothetical protein